MPRRRLVECRTDALDILGHFSLKVRHFFRTLVDQQYDHFDIGVIDADGVGKFLQQHRLARAGRRDDEPTLALADGRHQVRNPHPHLVLCGLQNNALFGVQRRQVAEYHLLGQLVRLLKIDRLDPKQGEIFFAFLGRTDLAGDDVAAAQAEPPNLRRRDIHIVRGGDIAVLGASQKAEAVRQDLQHAFAVHQAILTDTLFQDAKDQLLLGKPHIIIDAFLAGDAVQLHHVQVLQVGDMQVAPLDPLIFGVDGFFEGLLIVFFLGGLGRFGFLGGRGCLHGRAAVIGIVFFRRLGRFNYFHLRCFFGFVFFAVGTFFTHFRRAVCCRFLGHDDSLILKKSC